MSFVTNQFKNLRIVTLNVSVLRLLNADKLMDFQILYVWIEIGIDFVQAGVSFKVTRGCKL